MSGSNNNNILSGDSSEEEESDSICTRSRAAKRQKTKNEQHISQSVMCVEVHVSEPIIEWLSPAMSQEQAQSLKTDLVFDYYGVEWDSLSAQKVAKLDAEHSAKAQAYQIEGDEVPYPVKAIYQQAYVSFEDNPQDNMMIRVGDYAKVVSEDLRPDGEHYYWICKIIAMFVDIKDQEWYFCEWYYLDVDTPLSVIDDEGYKITPKNSNSEEYNGRNNIENKRIWKAEDSHVYNCSFKFETIEKLVTVYHITAGAEPKAELINQEDVYWCDQVTSVQFWTYQDINPKNTKHQSRKLQVLDMFCGCGGTSFLGLGSTEKVEIKTLWAVDFQTSMARTYQLNNPTVEVFNVKVQELYSMCQKIKSYENTFKQLGYDVTRIKTTSDDTLPVKAEDYQQIKDVKVCLTPQYIRKREKVSSENIEFRPQLTDVIVKFFVQIQDEETWLSDYELASEYPNLFVKWLRVQKQVPVVGEVDVIVGGPPCQGISGMNRHVKYDMETLIKGSKNGMLVWFYRFVQMFRPSFVLMEQVQSVFTKNQGLYIKTIQWQLLQLRYQSRIGICSAAGYGCPQTRPRVFLWAAKAGEQLPPFPEPIHHLRNPLQTHEDRCLVHFQTEEAVKNAYPPVIMGDILMDLPQICNFGSADVGKVKPLGPDSSVYLKWIRRQPQQQQYCGIDRINSRGIDRLAIDMDIDKDPNNLVTLFGNAFIRGLNKQYTQKVIEQIIPNMEKYNLLESLNRVKTEIGQKVLDGIKLNRKLLQQIRQDIQNESDDRFMWISDLRCLPLNYEDYMRIKNIPKGAGACFLHLPGVHTDPVTRRSCCGHFHLCNVRQDQTVLTRVSNKDRKPGVSYGEGIGQVFYLENCPSKTALIPGTLSPLCIESHFRLKNGRPRVCGVPCSDPYAASQHSQRSPFSRIWYGDAISTVFANPNASISLNFHPEQDRFLSPREVARAQGFPDYYVFDWDSILNPTQNIDSSTCSNRQRIAIKHTQVGNAVSPVMALHLGRCLAIAAAGDVPNNASVISVRGSYYDQAIQQGYNDGLSFYFEKGVRAGYNPSIKFAEDNNITIQQ